MSALHQLTFSRHEAWGDVWFEVEAAKASFDSTSSHEVAATNCCLPVEVQKAYAKVFSAAPDLLATAICESALHLPGSQGRIVLAQHGWIEGQGITATEFVQRMRAAAIAKATGQEGGAA